MYLYVISSLNSNKFYIGITKNISRRKAAHKWASKNRKSKLYNWMNNHPDWDIEVACRYDSLEELNSDEIFWIQFGRDNNWPLLNLADGGDGGFNIVDIISWREKLKESRKGRKPAEGMRHTEENKKLFSEVSKKYWNSQDTYTKELVCSLSFKLAKEKYHISKTHYYRLKRALNNEQC
jgi:hypothetical protein